MTMRGRTAVILVGVLTMTPSAVIAASRAQAPPIPAEFTDPTSEMVAASIHVWDPSGNVKTVETQTTDADESVLTLDSDILFAFGSADLPTAAVTRIAMLVANIPEGATVAVTGHTDDIGSDADNLVLSQRRAEAIAEALTAARADLRLNVEGRGESEPVEPNSEPEGREANRRAEIRYRG